MKKTIHSEMKKIAQEGAELARITGVQAKKVSKHAIRIMKNPSQVQGAARTAARTVVADAIQAHKSVRGAASHLSKLGKGFAAGVREGVRDAKKNQK
ncbi:hypothetical protein A3D71_00680 [Candidatus Kaiserbacteria bacterium RIFCSPHIGHO2_02_FULL_55_20]|uniref:Uncharacterized protein n=1 Tax=Candidatus Kaiserbacteria bacterium RIFCSPHIGHO2_02_FULL_55_20 TaxID=1798497 RepID=A0A1F6DX65_9BACT|nr:MAG: hypothetical protein A2680_00750 [Candidatus Kaiserbacteria bacterium RIFCSPHIGHO2_01_FULL_55_37]OGG65870.1 MAG: hypothetical protein A3D71_00680 [Candidatus Kaiserbacteria bacterium RIFCSPHIGHO2_02_FULL_55_20]